MNEEEQFGVVTEQGDLGLGFNPIKENVDIKESVKIGRRTSVNEDNKK